MQGVPEERVSWLERLVPNVRPGRIVEFGCGRGFVLEFLSRRFSDSLIVGIDRDLGRLRSVVEGRLRGVMPVRADIAQCSLRDAAFDTALFVGSLHELFSSKGLACIPHRLSAASPDAAAPATLRSVGLLNVSPRIRFRGPRSQALQPPPPPPLRDDSR